MIFRQFWRKPGLWLGTILGVVLTCGALPVRGDPASLIQTLMVVDQGHYISFQWSFYFVDFPKRFALQDDPSTTLTFDDPSTLEANLARLVPTAFDLKIDGRIVRPDKISRLTISPNKVCTVTMIYRGRPGAQVELRAPVLRYLPPASIINYEVLSLNRTHDLITGNLTAQRGPFAQVVAYRETGDGNGPAPGFEPVQVALFKAGLRIPWLNANWLFLALLLFLSLPVRRALIVLLIIAAGWMAGAFAVGLGRVVLPWTIPEWVTGFAVLLVGLAAARRVSVTGLCACGAGLINSAYDLQRVPWFSEEKTFSTVAALDAGFACSVVAIAVILLLIVTECKKFSEFETAWVPKLCWVIAAVALLLPLEKMLFG